LFDRCPAGLPGSPQDSSRFAVEHDHPEPAPQKQGLCQVAKMPDFEMLSAL
jgi:hypothetical protein